MKISITLFVVFLSVSAYAQTPKSTNSSDKSPQTTPLTTSAVVNIQEIKRDLRSFQDIKSDVYRVCYDLSKETEASSAQSGGGVKLLITSSKETGEVKRVKLLQSEVSDERLKRCIVKQTAKLIIPKSARESPSSQFMRELHVTKDRVMLGSGMVVMGTGVGGMGVVRSSNKRENKREKRERAVAASELSFAQGSRLWPIGDDLVVELSPPPRWGFKKYFAGSLSITNSTRVFSSMRQGSQITLQTECAGLCQHELLVDNIKQRAEKTLRKPRHTSQKPLTEVMPKSWSMSYTKIRRRETLYVIEVMRLQEGRDHFLKCKVELKEPDASDADLYEQFCLSLTLHNRANTPALLSAAMGSKFPLSPSITLELKPPSEGWEVSAFNVWRHKVTFSYQKRTELNISLTCSSTATPSCSAVHYPQNVQSQAEYEAQLKRRDGEAKWVKPFTALTPRISTWSFDIINADGQIQRRLLTLSASKPDAGSRLFYCTAELKPQDFKLNESVEAWCRERAEAYLAP